MSSRRRSRTLDSESGFTMIELLVTMAAATVVLLAILGASDIFASSTSSATRVSVGQDTGRSVHRDMVAAIRQSRLPSGETTPIAHTNTAVRDDLMFASYTATGAPSWSRYCAVGRTLYSGSIEADAYPTTAGFPGACGASGLGWTYSTLVDGNLVDGTELFDYSSDQCFGATGVCPPAATTVRSVGIRLAVGTGGSADPSKATLLTGAVSLRNRADVVTP